MQRDCCRVRDVEASEPARRRDAADEVAMLTGEMAQALAFGAEHERKRAREVSALERHARLFGEAHAEKAAVAERGQALREIRDEDHGHEVERAACGFGKRAR